MSIDARVTAVDYLLDGTARLTLEPISPRAIAGQPELIVENPAPHMESMVGTQIWGPSQCIMVRETRWAERVTSVRIRLNPPRKKATP